MPTLILFIFLIFAHSIAYSCPSGTPEGFFETKRGTGERLFVNEKRTAVIGIKCTLASKNESYKSLQFFKGRTVLDESTSYFSLNGGSGTISRIYFNVLDNELVQASITAKSNSPDELKALESSIVKFIRSR